MEEFQTSKEVSYLVTTTFLIGYVFGVRAILILALKTPNLNNLIQPMFWGPGSELVGRRPIFIITMILYTLFHLGQGLAKNMQTLLVTRFFAGFFAVAPLTNCGGKFPLWYLLDRRIDPVAVRRCR